MPIGESIAARTAALVSSVTEAEPAPEADKTAPPAPASGADSAPATKETTPEETAAQARELELAAKREVIEQKLAAERAKNEAKRQAKLARHHTQQAAADRQAAANERQKYEALREGNFKQVLTTLGRDPRQAFEEMQREAIEAGTPEAQIRAMRSDFERQMGEKLAPLQQAVEELRKERDALREETKYGRVQSAFESELKGDEFTPLRIEYSDESLLGFVKHFVDNPDTFHAAARQYKIPLTAPHKGFTMHEILTLLKVAQAHDKQEQQAREQRYAPPKPAEQSAASAPTVNGSTPKKTEPGNTIGNDLASERASARGRRMSRAERIQAEIRRLDRR